VRGGGELASAVARLLFLSGLRVVVLERAQPLAVRRQVAFAEAVFDGRAEVEGVIGRRVDKGAAWEAVESGVAVVVDAEAALVAHDRVDVLVDGRMNKRSPSARASGAAFTVGLGPGFHAGRDVDAVVETQRGPDLGRIVWNGAAEVDTRMPSPVLGHTGARVLRAPAAGAFAGRVDIGAIVAAGDVVGTVGGMPVASAIGGLVRGLLRSGVEIDAGTKVGDVDPRGASVDPARLSDKARAVAAGVLEAVLMRRKGLR
jgi:xanthine dehydrogenase accessory factor